MSHINTLIYFYASRGKIIDLIEEVATREIEESAACNQLFRGNTPFTRIYNCYCCKYCSNLLKEVNETCYQIFSMMNVEQILQFGTLSDKQAIAKEIIHTFSFFLSKCLSLIPSHLKTILKRIYKKVELHRLSKTEAKNAFFTLFFLRYCFTPFLRTPATLKILQQAIQNCSSHSKCSLDPNTVELKLAIDTIMNYVIHSPSEMSYGLINTNLQETSLLQIVNTLKLEMNSISKFYDGDFNEVFSVVKGRCDGTKSSNTTFAVSQLTSWEEDKLNVATQLNTELKREVEKLQKANNSLRSRIKFLNGICN